MKTDKILILSVIILIVLVLYFIRSQTTVVSREYVPVVYEDTRPRDTIIVGRWGGWGGWAGGHPPPPPPPPSPPPGPPPPAPPPPPAAEPPPPIVPAGFVDMSKNIESFFSPATYPFA